MNAMITEKEFRYLSADGKTAVYAKEYMPEGSARGIVQIAHGVSEYFGRYDAFARFLSDEGFIVVGNDHLGHGKTAATQDDLGYFCDFDAWNSVVDDMRALHDRTTAAHPGLPYFLFGHSMGSFLARTYLIRYQTGLNGAVISGTGHQGKALVSAGRAMGKLVCLTQGRRCKSSLLENMAFGSYNKGYTDVKTPHDWLSRDESVPAAYEADPLCGQPVTAGLFTDMMGGIACITDGKNIARMKKDLPVLFISGACDPVGENGKGVMRACRAFLNSGMQDVTVKLYPEGRHEMLNELNKDEVYADVLTWLNSKLPERSL